MTIAADSTPESSNRLKRELRAAEAKKRGTKVKNLTQTFNRLAQQTEEPVVPVGPHCSKPFECPYKFHCWKNAPKV